MYCYTILWICLKSLKSKETSENFVGLLWFTFLWLWFWHDVFFCHSSSKVYWWHWVIHQFSCAHTHTNVHTQACMSPSDIITVWICHHKKNLCWTLFHSGDTSVNSTKDSDIALVVQVSHCLSMNNILLFLVMFFYIQRKNVGSVM